jgi:hypothetical protein
MFPQYHRKLADLLRQALHLNKARADCFSACALAAIDAGSVRLADIAAHLPGKAAPESKFRRLQDFFAEVRPDYNALARFLMGMIKPVLGEQPLVLAIDRTNWEARGNDVNLLVLSICLGDAAQPLLWTDLGHPGNSDTKQRIRLVRRFLALFGRESIACLVADREFVGEDWFKWLIAERIPFVLRLRENMQTTPVEGRCRSAREHFNALCSGNFTDLGPGALCGVVMGVCGLRLPDGELLILGYGGVTGGDARDRFMSRWNIETGFEKLKSHGFNLEASRLRGGGKQERLLAVLAVGFAWCYSIGTWSVRKIKPLRFISKLGRRGQSVFARGRELLSGWLRGCCPALKRVSHKVFAVLRAALLAAT